MTPNDAIATFIHDVKQLLATDSTQQASLERIAARMRELVADPVIRSWQEEPIGNVHAGEPSPPIYQRWRRLDAGSGAGKAQVELIEERVLEPGDVVIVPAPPQDIHAQQGYEGEAAYELVLFGTNPVGKPRLYFDVKQGSAVLSPPR
jgi:hypothetical protein